jgi:hypothetical protein
MVMEVGVGCLRAKGGRVLDTILSYPPKKSIFDNVVVFDAATHAVFVAQLVRAFASQFKA